ncbi:MAG: dihydropteroate synthase [Hyphomicrobiales bacterium]|nr:dihydropteroate synthase [Hyphomicrobiales bacterium]
MTGAQSTGSHAATGAFTDPSGHALARLLAQQRTLIMGVLNVTPDSFSDGGRFLDPARAIAHAQQLVADGADILDIGAESTRPYGGALAIAADEEMRRLAPVLQPVAALGVPISIDTMKARVADWALAQGASIVNDVWGLQRDPDMARLVAARAVPVIVMHNRESADPACDIMADIAEFFSRSLAIADRAGILGNNIMLDPGIGFGKTPEQSITVLARLSALKSFGIPLLVGASRKRFIDAISPAPPDRRLGGSIAAHLAAMAGGAVIIRTHDVAETLQAMRVAAAIGEAR